MASYVLVVDDEASVRGFLTRRLEAWGYPAREAKDSTQALEMMSAEPADIVFVDLRMPGRDGLWLTEQIRQAWSDTAIVIATGADDFPSVEKARKLGAVDYVLKPFDQTMLRQALGRAFEALGRGKED
ncbi:MAG TPA: response regulator [Gemmatimonadaceae bacterium]|nr:response regulator [Gemmatimonadaceae bacterium]